MERVFVVNEQGQREEVDAVRYFEYNGLNYLIFDKNEKDENGYIKLYINKEQNGVVSPITDEEYAEIKTVFQRILKANRDSLALPVNDLNLNVPEIKVNPSKAFKLAENIVELLGKNKKTFESNNIGDMNSQAPINNPFNSGVINNNEPVMNNNDNFMSRFNNQANPFNSVNTNNQAPISNFNNSVNPNPMGGFGDNVATPTNTFDSGLNNLFGNNNFGSSEPSSNFSQSTFNPNPFGQQPLETNNVPFTSQTVNTVDTVDYKALYEEEKGKVESLNNEITSLNSELTSTKGELTTTKNELASIKSELSIYTNKLEQLKQIIG